jgi:hypothetical protein
MSGRTRLALLLLSLGFAFCFAVPAGHAAGRRPNILWIVS